MIPAILAAPMVQGILGSVVGGVMNAFGPSSAAPAQTTSPATSAAFASQLQRAAAILHSTAASAAPGTMQSTEWNQMTPKDAQTWLTSLSGRHIDATDASGRSISGVVSGVQLVGHNLSMNINGQVVSLSNLKQISWSSATV